MDSTAKQAASRSWVDWVAIGIATTFGAGLSPVAPGTAGSLVSVGLWLCFYRWSPKMLQIPFHLIFIIVLTAVGIWASTKSESWFGAVDPKQTVIDEVIGQQIAYLGLLRLSWSWLAVGFVLFRLFDIWKPYPIKRIQNLHGGTGIVMDDVAAGVYALIVLTAVRAAFAAFV